jgi:hypothetical protein
LLKKLRGRNPGEVAVVAESYKCYRDLLTTDTNFYGQHFDRIDLYPPDMIDRIITDDKTLVRPEIQRKRTALRQILQRQKNERWDFGKHGPEGYQA